MTGAKIGEMGFADMNTWEKLIDLILRMDEGQLMAFLADPAAQELLRPGRELPPSPLGDDEQPL